MRNFYSYLSDFPIVQSHLPNDWSIEPHVASGLSNLSLPPSASLPAAFNRSLLSPDRWVTTCAAVVMIGSLAGGLVGGALLAVALSEHLVHQRRSRNPIYFFIVSATINDLLNLLSTQVHMVTCIYEYIYCSEKAAWAFILTN